MFRTVTMYQQVHTVNCRQAKLILTQTFFLLSHHLVSFLYILTFMLCTENNMFGLVAVKHHCIGWYMLLGIEISWTLVTKKKMGPRCYASG